MNKDKQSTFYIVSNSVFPIQEGVLRASGGSYVRDHVLPAVEDSLKAEGSSEKDRKFDFSKVNLSGDVQDGKVVISVGYVGGRAETEALKGAMQSTAVEISGELNKNFKSGMIGFSCQETLGKVK